MSNLSKIDFKALSLGQAFATSDIFSGWSGQRLLLIQSRAIFFQCYANSLLAIKHIFITRNNFLQTMQQLKIKDCATQK